VKELVDTGKYRPVIDRRYALDEVVEATRYVETGQKTGSRCFQPSWRQWIEDGVPQIPNT
jgi:NADPH:quinone reductase-like Zn-dependent oxidoreductase